MTSQSASADQFTYTDRDGKQVTVEARLAGSGKGSVALELADGYMRIIPQGAISKRVPGDPPKPITHEEMAAKLTKRFSKKLTRTYIDKPFVVAIVFEAPLDSKDERRCSAFLKKAGRYLRAMERMFKGFADRYELPHHDPKFPLVMVIFESDIDFEKYTTKATGGQALSASRIAGFYSGETNWLAIRLNECHDFDTPLHEAIHQQVYNRGVTQRLSPVPTWFQEGIATGFAGNGKRVNVAPSMVSAKFARRTYRSKQINWATVVVDDSPFRGNDLAGDAYTHAWGMHWLLVTRYKKQYTEYVKKLNQKKTLGSVTREERAREFKETFGKSAGELQRSFAQVLAAAIRRERVSLRDPEPPGVNHVTSNLADVSILGAVRGGRIEVYGRLFNISPIRRMTFYVTVETDGGTYADWLIPELKYRTKTSLRKQLVLKRMRNSRGGPSRAFRVKVQCAVPGTEKEKRWRSGNVPIPVFGG